MSMQSGELGYVRKFKLDILFLFAWAEFRLFVVSFAYLFAIIFFYSSKNQRQTSSKFHVP